MGFLDNLLKRTNADPPPPELPKRTMRDMLFGDYSLDEWPLPGLSAEKAPWSDFVAARERLAAGDHDGAIELWRRIVATPDLEVQHYLQAWHFLREQGEAPPADVAERLHGVVVEVALGEGLDLLAAYEHHAARYFNYSGNAVFWEAFDDSMNAPIDMLLAAGRRVVAQTGPWEGPRPAPPPVGSIRLSFLTPGGIHIGEGSYDAITADPMGGPVLAAATRLMMALTERSNNDMGR